MSDQHDLDPSIDVLSQFHTPNFTPYQVKHPSGLVGEHMGTHLSIYAPTEKGGPATNLVSRVLFSNVPKNRHAKTGWPSTMDAVEALDEASKKIPGLMP